MWDVRARLLCGCIVIVWAYAIAIAGNAAEAEFEILYERAKQARDIGDFETAEAELRRALADRPDNVDGLYLLGMVLASQERYSDALTTLHGARRIDPDNGDVRLGIAQVLAWSGDFSTAQRELEILLLAQPGNVEARVFKARVTYWQGRPKAAERILVPVLDRDPQNLDALTLLGDLKNAEGDIAAAREFYLRALELAPDSREISEKLARSRSTPWRIVVGYDYSALSREQHDDWHEGFVQLRRALTSATGILGRVEIGSRFGQTDVHLAAGADHRFNEWLAGYVLAGGTPDADFRERWKVAGGGTVRLLPGGETFGATLLTIDVRHRDYSSGGVDLISSGLQQYLLSDRIWITGRSINTLDENDDWNSGWLGRLDWQAADAAAIYAGAVDAAETVRGETVDTRSYFAGLVFKLDSGRSLRFGYLRDDRKGSYVRDSVGLALSQDF